MRQLSTSFLFRTPSKAWQLVVLAIVIYASSPLFTIAYYTEKFRKDAYPPEADSILIPISNDFFGTLILAPVFLGFVYWVVRRYPGSVSLAAWNAKRSVWSGIWSGILGLEILRMTLGLVDVFHWGLPWEGINILIWIWLWLQIRAVVVSKL